MAKFNNDERKRWAAMPAEVKSQAEAAYREHQKICREIGVAPETADSYFREYLNDPHPLEYREKQTIHSQPFQRYNTYIAPTNPNWKL